MASYHLIYVALGGALGAMLRFIMVESAKQMLELSYHAYATAAVNIIGSFLIGVMFMLWQDSSSETVKYFIIIGVLGSFTTFSTFSLDTIFYIQQGQWGQALSYVMVSLLISLLAVIAGMASGKILL